MFAEEWHQVKTLLHLDLIKMNSFDIHGTCSCRNVTICTCISLNYQEVFVFCKRTETLLKLYRNLELKFIIIFIIIPDL